jgi:putative membrane protein
MSETERHVARQADNVRESARQLERSAGAVRSSTDRNTELAADRTILAAERTYAAWVRTGLTSLASGVGAKALLTPALPRGFPPWFATLTGSVLVAFSAFCFVAAIWRELYPGAPPPKPDTHRLPRGLLVGVNGFLVIVAVAVVVGIWSA